MLIFAIYDRAASHPVKIIITEEWIEAVVLKHG